MLNHGVLVALLRVSPASAEVVLTAPVRPLTVTCVAVEGCLLPPKSGAVGTARSTSTRNATPCAPPWPLPESLHWSCPKVKTCSSQQSLIVFLSLFEKHFGCDYYCSTNFLEPLSRDYRTLDQQCSRNAAGCFRQGPRVLQDQGGCCPPPPASRLV